MKLTGAAILVSRGMQVFQAAPAAYPYRSTQEGTLLEASTVEDVLALLKDRPDDAELYQRLGGLYLKQRDVMEAWQAYMQSLRLNPDDPFTCLYFGNLLSLCDDKKWAWELYEHAAEVAPDLAVVHWCQGDLARKMNDFDRAERAYCEAVEADPDDEQARAKLVEWRTFIAGVRGS
jgi:cytochrome c-type biogenesis protein CcmH/NrfG